MLETLLLSLGPVGGAVLGYWVAGQQERRNRKEAELAQRRRELLESLTDASVLLDRALPDRFAFSFNHEHSPSQLRGYLDEWERVQRGLAHARLVAATSSDERERLHALSGAMNSLLNRLGWITSEMPGGDYRDTLGEAREYHERACELIRTLSEQ